MQSAILSGTTDPGATHPGDPGVQDPPLKLTNGSDQNVMDPLNFTSHGMSKSVNPLPSCSHQKLSLSIQKKLENEQIMTQKTKKSSSGGQHSKLGTWN